MDRRNWTAALGALGVVAAFMLIFILFGRGIGDDAETDDIASMPTTSRATTPTRDPIMEEGGPEEYRVTETTSSSPPLPPACPPGECDAHENLPVVGNWEETITGFLNAYGRIGNKSHEEWLAELEPYTTPSLQSQLERIDYGRVTPGGKPDIIITDTSTFNSLTARANYPEGWSIYIRVDNRGEPFGGWKVDLIDTPRDRWLNHEG